MKYIESDEDFRFRISKRYGVKPADIALLSGEDLDLYAKFINLPRVIIEVPDDERIA